MRRWLALVVAAAALAGCSSLSVKTDFDSRASFGKYKTFAWKPAERGPAAVPEEYQTLTDTRARGAIEAELERKGLKPAASGERPDLYLVFDNWTTERFQFGPVSGYCYPFDYATCYSYSSTTGRSHDFERNLMVSLVDSATRRTVWVGVARDTSDAQLLDKRSVDDAVHEMLEHYPPKLRSPAATP